MAPPVVVVVVVVLVTVLVLVGLMLSALSLYDAISGLESVACTSVAGSSGAEPASMQGTVRDAVVVMAAGGQEGPASGRHREP